MKKPASITNEQAAMIMSRLHGYDRTIFWVGIETGMRISDILALKTHQIRQNPLVFWESKSKRSRSVKLSEELHRYLWMAYGWRDSDTLCFNAQDGTGKAIHRSTYHRRLKRAVKGLKINVSAHSTRKLYAQNVFEECEDIFKVQESLNHVYVQTTAPYLDIDIVKLVQQEIAARKDRNKHKELHEKNENPGGG